MIIAVLTVDLYLPGSFSLKDKRMVLRKIKDRIGHKYNVSIAEVDFLDKWQRARLGICQVGTDYKFLEKSLQSVFKAIDNNGLAEVVDHSIEYL
ncbi:MAG: DUF503 domain-containing protein [Calditrichaeota bacterium]|nr:MAG: DUF503 domain-containing protein [Calditrichota bacterium]